MLRANTSFEVSLVTAERKRKRKGKCSRDYIRSLCPRDAADKGAFMEVYGGGEDVTHCCFRSLETVSEFVSVQVDHLLFLYQLDNAGQEEAKCVCILISIIIIK